MKLGWQGTILQVLEDSSVSKRWPLSIFLKLFSKITLNFASQNPSPFNCTDGETISSTCRGNHMTGTHCRHLKMSPNNTHLLLGGQHSTRCSSWHTQGFLPLWYSPTVLASNQQTWWKKTWQAVLGCDVDGLLLLQKEAVLPDAETLPLPQHRDLHLSKQCFAVQVTEEGLLSCKMLDFKSGR